MNHTARLSENMVTAKPNPNAGMVSTPRRMLQWHRTALRDDSPGPTDAGSLMLLPFEIDPRRQQRPVLHIQPHKRGKRARRIKEEEG